MTEAAKDTGEVDMASGSEADGDGAEQLPRLIVQSSGKKVFNDPVHGHIELHPLLVLIIDTPEFQRLRFIKQMGMCYFVYPGASHNRFEHSIGVCHLAGELARHLQAQEEISKEEILCVEIAGLCHDLGHGPFSHLFDELFLPKVLSKDREVKHEKLSVAMFKYMLKENRLEEKFRGYKLGKEEILFIEEMIEGVPKEERKSKIGKNSEKSFFFDIVANKRNGIDVDKWDYLARDSLYLGISNLFDWRRYLKFARVLKTNGDKEICTRDKEITNLYDMFHTRYTIHHRACQHRVTRILEAMVVEALVAANDHLKIPGEKGKEKTMLQSIDDMEAYTKLTDNVIWQIIFSTDKKLEKSRKLLNRILKREIYVCIGQTKLEELPKGTTNEMRIKKNDEIKQKFLKYWGTTKPQRSDQREDSDIFLHISEFDYGMKEKDPVENVKFYRKNKVNQTVDMREVLQNSMALPKLFSERIFRVFGTEPNSDINLSIKKAFEDWCPTAGLKPMPGDI